MIIFLAVMAAIAGVAVYLCERVDAPAAASSAKPARHSEAPFLD